MSLAPGAEPAEKLVLHQRQLATAYMKLGRRVEAAAVLASLLPEAKGDTALLSLQCVIAEALVSICKNID